MEQITLCVARHFAIGSRYTVRGFDGERNLSGERGWYGQNLTGIICPSIKPISALITAACPA